jgi:hypothetical protein
MSIQPENEKLEISQQAITELSNEQMEAITGGRAEKRPQRSSDSNPPIRPIAHPTEPAPIAPTPIAPTPIATIAPIAPIAHPGEPAPIAHLGELAPDRPIAIPNFPFSPHPTAPNPESPRR